MQLKMEDYELEQEITDYLTEYPDSVAQDMALSLRSLGERNARCRKAIVNQQLYSMRDQGVVIKVKPRVGTKQPRWRLCTLPPVTTVPQEEEDEVKRLLYVDLDHCNVPHKRILQFRGQVHLFCSREVGAASKFPGMSIHQARWSCPSVNLYSMFTQAAQFLDSHSSGWQFFILSRNKALDNVVYAAEEAGHEAHRLEEAREIPK